LPHKIQETGCRLRDGEDAQTMAEYAVVLGVITLAIVTSYALLAGAIQDLLSRVAGLFS
jgi:Flp pilus assembly pilin Flp